MHRKAANKQILKVGVVVLAVIILVAILFAVSPREVRTGQATGGPVDSTGSCTTAPNVFGPISTRVKAADGSPISIMPQMCCPRGTSACGRSLGRIGSSLINAECFNNGEVAAGLQVLTSGGTPVNAYTDLCSSGELVRCRSSPPAAAQADNGIINDGFICVSQQIRGSGLGNVAAGTWASTSTGCTAANRGESYNGVAYCDGTSWTNSCTRTTSESRLPDDTLTNTASSQACCQANSCALGVGCHPVGNRPRDTNPLFQSNLVCSRDGNWEECDSLSAIARGAISSNGRFVCFQSNEWVPVTQGCNAANRGQSYGNAYCDGTRWQTCTGTNVYCPNSADQIFSPTQSLICNQQRANTVIGNVVNNPEAGTHHCVIDSATNQGRWVRCDQTTLGQGVSNAEPDIYAHNYVCSNFPTAGGFAWRTINCPASVCGVSTTAICAGSSELDVITGVDTIFTTPYYENPARYVGCVSQNGCYLDADGDPTTPNTFNFDERSGLNVCGNQNQWLSCQSGGASRIPVPSDGGRWLCESNVGWIECNANGGTANSRTVGQQIGSFVCTQTSPGIFQWFSSLACAPSHKFRLTNNGRSICDGQNVVSCPILPDSSLLSDPNVEVNCGTGGVITVTELACNNVAANNLPIDDDNDGAANCQDNQCSQLQTVTINDDNAYSVNLKSTDCYDVNVNADLAGRSNYYGNLELCDVGVGGSTVGVADRATLCYARTMAGPQAGDFVVESLTSIAGDSLRTMDVNVNPDIPTTSLQNPELTFVYKRPTTGLKEVKVVYTKDISANPVAMPLGTLAQNMLADQSLVLLLDNEYYLVSYPSSELLFSVDNLMISHLPTDTNIMARPYSGANSYIFNVGARSIVVTADVATITFSSVSPGEVPAGRVIERNISRDYEVQITTQTPVRVKHQESGVENRFTICRQDVVADIDQALFCVDDVLTFALKRNNLTYYNPTITGLDDYALLYDFNGSDKIISIFELENLDINTPTSANPRNVIYSNYINNLVAGRRLAVRYATKLYLISHPIQPTFSQSITKFTSFIEGVATDFNAVGSEGLVDYNILDGRITVKRRYGQVPPLPFQMSVLSSRQILNQPIDLLRELSASMTSELPISISGPINYGILNKSNNDRIALQAQLRLHQDQPLPVGQDFTLSYNTPAIQTGTTVRTVGSSQVLLHYNSADALGSGPNSRLVKTVALYLLYDVTTEGGTVRDHSFDSTFLSSFTAGKEIAIKYDNSYYLLSYQGAAANTAQFFTLDKLVLSTLDKSQTFQPSVSGLAATFNLPEGQLRIDLILDPIAARANDVIRFSGGVSALTPRIFGANEYMVPITSTGLVSIGDPAAGLSYVTLDICQEERYAGQTAARICATISGAPGGTVVSNFEVNQPTLFAVDDDNDPNTDNSRHFILETNGRTDAAKQVFIRRIINLYNPRLPTSASNTGYTVFDWNLFARNVSIGFGPAFNISGTMYSPEAQSQDILSFAFRDYPAAAIRYPIRQQNQMTTILYNVTYVLGDDVVTIVQEENSLRGVRATVTSAEITLQPYQYLKDDKSILLFNATTNDLTELFVTDLPSPVYRINVLPRPTTSRANVVRLQLVDDNARTYVNRYFAAGDRQDIRLGSGFVTISVPLIVYQDNGNLIHAHVAMKRK